MKAPSAPSSSITPTLSATPSIPPLAKPLATPSVSRGFDEQFEVLRRAYGDRLDEKVSAIESGWRHYLALPVGAEKRKSLETLHRATHSLAGSGATFGFPLISQFARRAEIVLKAMVENIGSDFSDDDKSREKVQTSTHEQITEIEAAHAGLRAATQERAQPHARLTLQESAGLNDRSQPPISNYPLGLGQASSGAFAGIGAGVPGAVAAGLAVTREQFLLAGGAPLELPPVPPNALVYMFCEHSEAVPSWAASIETFGYRLEIFSDAIALQAATAREMPAALIVSSQSEPIQVGDRGEPLGGVLHTIKGQGDHQVPLVWVCDDGDLRARLQAVRLGAAAFFAHPIDVDALLVKLDDLTALHTPEPFRVLIVDDEPALARLYSVILNQAGMETREVTDPLDVMEPLVDFRPDLILMDVYMPECNGSEIAAVIRQQEAYVGIPIMFLSSESDTGKQLEAMRLGGDEFLQKPVEPRYLVSSVLTRATRARVLQNLMIRDSLTGLLNHTKTKEQLGIEIERMRRLGHTISLAMIDIDHFKKVNDTYGHATGDRVLRSLSRLLSQRMRQTDVVGRYGGEEFAVIMVGANAENAQRAIDKVREAWAQLPHFSNGREFYSTFSAGVAAAPPHKTAATLSESADAALYQAKGKGRNRVALGE